jgi:hypothetical protein
MGIVLEVASRVVSFTSSVRRCTGTTDGFLPAHLILGFHSQAAYPLRSCEIADYYYPYAFDNQESAGFGKTVVFEPIHSKMG